MAGRRRTGGTLPTFKNEAEIDAALADMRALPPGQQDEAWRSLQPRIARYVLKHWAAPVKGSGAMEWALKIADSYYRLGKFRSMNPPAGYTPDTD